jgi:hypothetical protein
MKLRHRAQPRITRVSNASRKRRAKTTLAVRIELVAGTPAIAAAAPGKVIKANKIIHPSMFSNLLLFFRWQTNGQPGT